MMPSTNTTTDCCDDSPATAVAAAPSTTATTSSKQPESPTKSPDRKKQRITLSFSRLGAGVDKKNCEFVMKHAKDTSHGYKYSMQMASDFKDKLQLAREARDWAAAAEAKAARDKWLAIANKEEEMLCKSLWAINHATDRLAYYDLREEFDKCPYYEDLLTRSCGSAR